MLKKAIKLNLDDMALITAVLAGCFALEQLIMNIIMLAVKPDSVPTLGGIMLPVFALMLSLFVNVIQIPMNFDFMLRYSVTRRCALASTLILMALETAWAFGLALALGLADRLIANVWLHFRPDLFLEELAVPLWGLAVMAGAAILLGLIGGAALQYFGRKAMWVIWAAWMVFVFLMNALGWEDVNLVNIPPACIPVAVVILAGLAGLSAWSLLRSSVRS